MNLFLPALLALAALTSVARAEPVKLTDAQMDRVAGGWLETTLDFALDVLRVAASEDQLADLRQDVGMALVEAPDTDAAVDAVADAVEPFAEQIGDNTELSVQSQVNNGQFQRVLTLDGPNGTAMLTVTRAAD